MEENVTNEVPAGETAATPTDTATAALLQQLMNELKGYKEKEAKAKEYNLNSQAKTIVILRKAKERGITASPEEIADERRVMATRTRSRV